MGKVRVETEKLEWRAASESVFIGSKKIVLVLIATIVTVHASFLDQMIEVCAGRKHVAMESSRRILLATEP